MPTLEQDDRRRLQDIVANLYDFTGSPRDRRVFLLNAGLEQFVSRLDLNGAASTIASDLVFRLDEYGPLSNRPKYHALGSLLSYLLSLSDVSQEDRVFLASLITNYNLVDDGGYKSKLILDYTLPVSLDNANAPLTIPSDQEPTFQFALQDEKGLEQVINSEDNFLDVYSLLGAFYSSQAVGRIESPKGNPKGTGFLINKDLFLTNHHVLASQDAASQAVVRFGYQNDASGVPLSGMLATIQENFYYSSPPEQLDYALLRLNEPPLAAMMTEGAKQLSWLELVQAGKHQGYLSIVPRSIQRYDRVNIIQHPLGNPTKVVLTQNYVIANMTETRVHYLADTDKGSSGSPVFNMNWEVVALHHSGKPYPSNLLDPLKNVLKGHPKVNEGIPMRAILKDFKDKGLERFLSK